MNNNFIYFRFWPKLKFGLQSVQKIQTNNVLALARHLLRLLKFSLCTSFLGNIFYNIWNASDVLCCCLRVLEQNCISKLFSGGQTKKLWPIENGKNFEFESVPWSQSWTDFKNILLRSSWHHYLPKYSHND